MRRETSLPSKLNPGWALAGFGLVAVIVVTVLTAPPSNAFGAALLFVGLLAGGFLSIAVHEFGHAAAAWLVGWRVWIISVLGIVVRLGYAPRLSTRYAADVGGYVMGSPPTAEHDSRWRSIVFTAGGPLASLATGPLFIAWLATLPRDGWETATGAGVLGAMLAFGVGSTSSAFWTIWPMYRPRPNDMGMILASLAERTSPADARGASWAWGLFAHGIEPAVWPIWMREAVTRSAQGAWPVANALILEFLIALADGDETRAKQVAQRSTHPSGKVLRAAVSCFFDADVSPADLPSIDEADSDALAHLLALIEIRTLTLKGELDAAAQSHARFIYDLRDSGAPQPFWEALLARVETYPTSGASRSASASAPD